MNDYFLNAKKIFTLFLSITSLAILNNSCVSSEGKSSLNRTRFSKDLDTSYKANSTEIESITRTFYNYEVGDNKLKLTQELNDTSFALTIFNGNNISSAIFMNNKEIIKFFSDLKTVSSNPNKDLRYTIGTLQEGSLSLSGDDISLYLPAAISTSQSVLINIKKSEIDSLESCYNRYIKEIKK
jgi:hypothetical protein